MIKYSNSRIQCFKSCRRMYQLKYVYGVQPIQKADSLQTGSSYHEKVEQINKTGDFERDGNAKTNAMAFAYKKYILPKLGGKVVDAEVWWEDNILGIQCCGIIDAVREDGVPIEHKTTSGTIDGNYWLGLENDEQILMYMRATRKTTIVYDVVQVPTIRQKKDETDEEFEQRCIDWYDESKAQVNIIERDWIRLFEFENDFLNVVTDIERCEESTNKPYYPNPNNCHKWGRLCEYAPICNSYDPNQEYIDFEVVKKDG